MFLDAEGMTEIREPRESQIRRVIKSLRSYAEAGDA
jgi:hypothetical protein